MPAWVDAAVGDYAARLPRELRLEWQQVRLAGKASAGARTAVEREGELILKRLAPSDHVVALAVTGTPWSTLTLAEQLQGWQRLGTDVAFLVGGPDGLSPACLARAQQQWSLSPLTLPHPLVRVLLAEQLYRAWTMTVNHPYHRG